MMDRRSFVKIGSLAGTAALLPKFSFAAVKGSDTIKVGLVGCGGRGTGAFANMATADKNIKLVAVADLFGDRSENAFKRIQNNMKKAKIDDADAAKIVEPDKVKKFSGFDAIDGLLKEDVDVVIDATPPIFRTPHFEKIVAAGKHAFLEKPAAVDITQARKMYKLADEADKKGLTVVCGNQRRYADRYADMVKRIQDGEFGEPISMECYWNAGYYVGGANIDKLNLDISSIEYQIRKWGAFIWTSGDHIVEQHVHNIDVLMWVLGDNRFPEDLRGLGGRSNELEAPKHGDRFSHFQIDYNMGQGLRMQSYCQQDPGASGDVSERVTLSKGVIANMGRNFVDAKTGKEIMRAKSGGLDPYINEHVVLLKSIRNGQRVNALRPLLNTNLVAIAGRESAFSGQKFKYQAYVAKANQDLMPKDMNLKALNPVKVPVPGKYKWA
ncbi:MAG: oxidoreductase [Verrucomicrobia bacterium]|nr:MAG: oxidoreductase [Verrucomicrobiota bacterium]